MSQTNPFGGFFQDAGVQIAPGNGPYGRDPVTKGDVAVVESGSHPSANDNSNAGGTAEYAVGEAHDVGTSAPSPTSDNNVAQVQTDDDPANVSGPAPEVGLADVYGAVQALDSKIDDLFAQSPWVQPKADPD